jgi:hypothetical protein
VLRARLARPPAAGAATAAAPAPDRESFNRMSWDALLAKGGVVRRRVTSAEVAAALAQAGAPDAKLEESLGKPDDVYIDFATALFTLPAIGGNLVGMLNFDEYRNKLPNGGQAIFVASKGRYNFLGYKFTQDRHFDRLRVAQDGHTFEFVQDNYQFINPFAEGIKGMEDAALFALPANSGFDPDKPWQLEILIHTASDPPVTVAFGLDYKLPDLQALTKPDEAPAAQPVAADQAAPTDIKTSELDLPLDTEHLINLLKRRPECGNPCHLCERSCPVRAIEKTGKIVTAECFQCLDCQVEYFDDKRCPPLVQAAKLRVAGAKPVPVMPKNAWGGAAAFGAGRRKAGLRQQLLRISPDATDEFCSGLLTRKRACLASPRLHAMHVIGLLTEFAHVGGQAALHRIGRGLGRAPCRRCDRVVGRHGATKPTGEGTGRYRTLGLELLERIRPGARDFRLGTSQEPGADLDRAGAQGESRCHAAPVGDASGGNEGQVGDLVGDARQQREERAALTCRSARIERAAMSAGFDALHHDRVGPGFAGLLRLLESGHAAKPRDVPPLVLAHEVGAEEPHDRRYRRWPHLEEGLALCLEVEKPHVAGFRRHRRSPAGQEVADPQLQFGVPCGRRIGNPNVELERAIAL